MAKLDLAKIGLRDLKQVKRVWVTDGMGNKKATNQTVVERTTQPHLNEEEAKLVAGVVKKDAWNKFDDGHVQTGYEGRRFILTNELFDKVYGTK